MKCLILAADFYTDLADMLIDGATNALAVREVSYDIERFPGALEIPPAIAIASKAQHYDGYIALGCVIRGETTHYDYVCGESARGLVDLGIQKLLPIGNGILTTESREQAIVRADPKQKNKGRDAALACLRLIELQQKIA